MLAPAEFQELLKAGHFGRCHGGIADDDQEALLAAHGHAEAIFEEQVTETSPLKGFVFSGFFFLCHFLLSVAGLVPVG